MQNWRQGVIIEAASKQFVSIEAPVGLQKVTLGKIRFWDNAEQNNS